MASQLALRPSSALTSAGPSKVPSKAVPAFLHKLYNMVDDPSTDNLIKWTENGDSFIVLDHEQFARSVLGRWFKHQNFASFVRQLNMYGFHKVPHLQQGVLRTESDTEVINFENPNFKRGQPDLLCLIQRKKQLPTAGNLGPDFALMDGDVDPTDIKTAGSFTKTTAGPVVDVNAIVNGIAAIKRHQAAISTELKALQTSNQHLWQEAIAARERHKKNEDTINRILKFLAGVFGSTAGAGGEPPGTRRPPSAVPVKRPRLMIEDGQVSKPQILDAESPGVLDLPASITDDTESIDTDRFSTVDTPQITELQSPLPTMEPTTPKFPQQTTTPGTSAPSQNLPGGSGLMDKGSHYVQQGALDPGSPAGLMDASTFPQDPYISDAILQLLNNSDDLQRLLESFPVLPLDDTQNGLLENNDAGSALVPREEHTIRSPYAAAAELQHLSEQGSDIVSRVDAVQTDIDSIIHSIGLNPDDIQFDIGNLGYPMLDPHNSTDMPDNGMADFEFAPYLDSLSLLPSTPPSGEVESIASVETVPDDPLLQEVTNTNPASPSRSNAENGKKRKSLTPNDFTSPQGPVKRKRK